MNEIDNHMISREDLPSISELNRKLEDASERLKFVERVGRFIEDAMEDAKRMGLSMEPFNLMFLSMHNELKIANALFETAYARFTNGSLSEAKEG